MLPAASASSTMSKTSTFSTSRTHSSDAVTNSSNDDNVLVAPPQETTHHFTRSSTTPPVSWITCSSSRELVCAIDTMVRPDDCVAELGSQLRDVSNAICHKLEGLGGGTGCAVLVDVKRTIDPERCYSSTYAKQTRATRTVTPPLLDRGDDKGVQKPVAQFMEIKALDGWRQAFLDAATNNNISYTVLVLDLNAIVGNDLEWTSLALVREFVTLFPTCQTVLVKSVNLNQWATRLVHADRWIAGQVEGPFLRTTGPNQEHHPETAVQDPTSDSTTANNANQGEMRVHSPKIIATVGVEQYRQTIARSVQSGDAVLEVGCHLGTTTHLLQQAATANGGDGGYAIGVDCGSKIIRGAQKRYPDQFFSVGNAWKTAELLRIQQQSWLWSNQCPQRRTAEVPTTTTHLPQHPRLGFDVVYVDVGGLSGKDGLLEALSLISALMNALEPRCLVIKSLCVTRLSSTLRPFWQIHGKHQAAAAAANAIK